MIQFFFKVFCMRVGGARLLCVWVGVKFLSHTYKTGCPSVDAMEAGADSPTVVIEIADTVDRSVAITEDGDKIMGA
jgi:hypothetical protein